MNAIGLVWSGGSYLLGRGILSFLFLIGTVPAATSAETYHVGAGRTYATINAALDVASAGDTVVIHEGTYREQVVVQDDDITLTGAVGEHVLITGLDLAAGWVQDSGSVYKKSGVSFTDLDYPQVFVNGRRMQPAAFPDLPSDWHYNDWGMDSWAYNCTNGIAEVEMNTGMSANYWQNGIYLGLNGAAWVSIEGRISSSTGTNIICTDVTASYWEQTENTKMVGAGKGFILWHRNALDSSGEFHWDPSTSTVYIWEPGGEDPDNINVEIRTRKWGLVLDGRSGVVIRNIHFRGAAVSLNDCENCSIFDCSVLYGTAYANRFGQSENYTEYAIDITGESFGTTVVGCYVAHSWGGGIRLSGDDSCIEDCVIEDCNWYGAWGSGIWLQNGWFHQIRGNTIRSMGRSAISGNPRESDIIGNYLGYCLRLSRDGGATYLIRFLGAYNNYAAQLAYNWVEQSYDLINPYTHAIPNVSAGFYTDIGSDGFVHHHNVISRTRSGAILNAREENDAEDHEFYNNTIWDCTQSMRVGTLGNIIAKVYNNLSNDDDWAGTNHSCNLSYTNAASLFVDSTPDEPSDYRLKAGSVAIGYGRVKDGIPLASEYDGVYPEAGAYEYDSPTGLDNWSAGATSRALACDDFETGDDAGGVGWLGDWSLNGEAIMQTGYVYHGQYALRLRGSEGYDSASRQVALRDLKTGTLTFWWRAYSFDSGDSATVQIIDGNTTYDLKVISAEQDGASHVAEDWFEWRFATIDLSGYSFELDTQTLKFNTTGLDGSGDYLYIDDVSIDDYEPKVHLYEQDFENITVGESLAELNGWILVQTGANQHVTGSTNYISPFGEGSRSVRYYDYQSGMNDLRFKYGNMQLPSNETVYLTFDYYRTVADVNPTLLFRSSDGTKGVQLTFDYNQKIYNHNGTSSIQVDPYLMEGGVWYRFELRLNPVSGNNDCYDLKVIRHTGTGIGEVVVDARALPFYSDVDNLESIEFGTWAGTGANGVESYYDNIRIRSELADVPLDEDFETLAVDDSVATLPNWAVACAGTDQYVTGSTNQASVFEGGSRAARYYDYQDSGLNNLRFQRSNMALFAEDTTRLTFDYYRTDDGYNPTLLVYDSSGNIGIHLVYDYDGKVQVRDESTMKNVSSYTMKSNTWYRFELDIPPVSGDNDQFDLSLIEEDPNGIGHVVVTARALPFRNNVDDLDDVSFGTYTGVGANGFNSYYDNIKAICCWTEMLLDEDFESLDSGESVDILTDWYVGPTGTSQYVRCTTAFPPSPFGKGTHALQYSDNQNDGLSNLRFTVAKLGVTAEDTVRITFDYYVSDPEANPTLFVKDAEGTVGIQLTYDYNSKVYVHDGSSSLEVFPQFSLQENTWYRFVICMAPLSGPNDCFGLTIAEADANGIGQVVVDVPVLPFKNDISDIHSLEFGTNTGAGMTGQESCYDNISVRIVNVGQKLLW